MAPKGGRKCKRKNCLQRYARRHQLQLSTRCRRTSPGTASSTLQPRFLGFSKNYFRVAAQRGDVPAPVRLTERKVGWRIGDLVDWLAARVEQPTGA